jgi:hypothetical protein
MIRINLNRTNAFRSLASRDSVAWGAKGNTSEAKMNTHEIRNLTSATLGNLNALAFAATLIVCSLAVGCSNDKPQPVKSSSQIAAPMVPGAVTPAPAPVLQAENKPASRKVVHRKPATVNYTDKTYGVTFEYPRRYAIETGDAATDLLTSSPVPMNFVAPGGLALAAVELPETSFANTDFSSAFFNVSVHKNLTADQCNEFAVPMPKTVTPQPVPDNSAAAKPATEAVTPSSAEPAAIASTTQPAESAKPSATDMQPAATQPVAAEAAKAELPAPVSSPSDSGSGSKLLLGDMELRATEAVSGEGTRQSDSKYFHIYQNGSCYEFALNVTTVASSDGLIRHVDRDKVFSRLEKILDTVKINPAAQEVTAESPSTAPAATPAQ